MTCERPKLFDPIDDTSHLNAAMEWLCRAHDRTGGGGVAAHYHLVDKKWGNAYPETTGYIVSTFLLYEEAFGKREYLDRAINMGNWEIEIQLDNGGCLAGDVTYKYPRVFNTGQIIEGWCNLYRRTGDRRYLEAAERAGDWVVRMQDDDGKWTNCSYDGPKVYHSRVAWPMLSLYLLTGKRIYRRSAAKFADWAETQRRPNGWYEKMCAINPVRPNMHFISYALEGFLEMSLALKNEKLFEQTEAAAERLRAKFEDCRARPDEPPYGFLPVTFDEKWESKDHSSSLTGDMQLAIVWLKLFKKKGERKYYESATALIERVKQTQDLAASDAAVRGGICGSHPVWGVYGSNMILNWATNFFAHALLLKKKLAANLPS